MNKTITIYELLGLVKDGKALKKILSHGLEYEFDIEAKTYIHRITECAFYDLMDEYDDDLDVFLNGTVEIIEDNDKLKKIEKEELFALDESMTKSSLVAWQKANNGIFKKQIDFLIDHINKIEEKLDEK